MLGETLDKIKALIQKRKVAVYLSATVVGLLLIAGIIYAVSYEDNKKQPVAEQDEPKEIIEIDTDEEEPEEIQEVVREVRNISFSGTSIEKDLKIKIVDENTTLVSGVLFKVAVAPEGNAQKSKDYTDEDMDGVIHIQQIEAGTYTVQLYETEGFAIAENPITVQVKAKIEYKKVEVKEEIKKESEVNVKVEDTAINNVPEVDTVINTLPLLESTKETKVVAKESIDTSNFTKASVSDAKKQETIFDNVTVTSPESVQLYDVGETTSKSCQVDLEIADADNTIGDIEWQMQTAEKF